MNNSGLITIDYLFALVLVSGFSFILFAMSLSLSMVEVVQYMTFASARTFFAGGMNEEQQRTDAILKFQDLQQSETLQPLLSSGWFEVGVGGFSKKLTVGSDLPAMKPELKDYAQDPNSNLFTGAVVWFTANVLDFNIPFYGSTVNDDMRGGSEFGAYIGSYLGREVTQEECENMIVDRWEKIKQLPTGGNAPYTQVQDDSYVAMADNGC